MALVETLNALLTATSALEDVSSRGDLENMLYAYGKGQITERELAETGEALLGDLDDRSMSDIAAWQPAADAVQAVLYA